MQTVEIFTKARGSVARHTFTVQRAFQTRGGSLRGTNKARPRSQPDVVSRLPLADDASSVGGGRTGTPRSRRRLDRDDSRANQETLLEALELALIGAGSVVGVGDADLDVLERLPRPELQGDLEGNSLRDLPRIHEPNTRIGAGVVRLVLLPAPLALVRGQHGVISATLSGRIQRQAQGDAKRGQSDHGQPENPAGLEDAGHPSSSFLRHSRIVALLMIEPGDYCPPFVWQYSTDPIYTLCLSDSSDLC